MLLSGLVTVVCLSVWMEEQFETVREWPDTRLSHSLLSALVLVAPREREKKKKKSKFKIQG